MEDRLGAQGKEFQISLLDRCLIAGRDFWFYLGKLFWPHPLILIYPRWKIAPSPPLAWFSLLAFVPVAIILWLARHTWGRPVFVAFAYFVGMLFLTFGFFDIGLFRFSFVSDHFQYFACLGPIVLFAAGATLALNRPGKTKPALAPLLSVCLLVVLGTLTWKQSQMFANAETLWRTTLLQNPGAYAAYANLGDVFMKRGQMDRAIEQYQKALALHPDPPTY
jgi:tetratricopeptide (TPR) repeat protein